MNVREGIAFLSLLCGLGLAQARRPGATFLLIPPTAKATGMAYAYSAIASDASANYYNGAGLAFLESPSITTTYFTYLTGLHPDMRYFYIAAAYPFSKSALGFDITYFMLGRVSILDEMGNLNSEPLIWRIVPKISYALKVSNKAAFSIGWKYIKQQRGIISPWDQSSWVYMGNLGIDGGTGSSWAFDVSFLCNVLPNLTIGSVLHNAGPSIECIDEKQMYIPEYSGESRPLPWLYRLGLSYKLVDNKYISGTIAAEVTKIIVNMFSDSEKSFWENLGYEIEEAWKGVGLEVTIYHIVSLRGGYFYDEEGARKGFTFGSGISYKGLAFDIGIDEDIFDFETRNRKLSLTYTF